MGHVCVREVREVQGDDSAWCAASDKGIAAAVADGVSEIDPGGGFKPLKGYYASKEAIEGFTRLYSCMLDHSCLGEADMGYEDLTSPFLNTTVAPGMKVLRWLVKQLRAIRGSGGKASFLAATTLAGGIMTSSSGVLVTSGDSMVTMTFCPLTREGVSLALEDELRFMMDNWLASLRLEPRNSHVKYTVSTRPTSRFGFFTSYELRIVSPIVQPLPPSTVSTLSRLYGGVVIQAWTDGVRLESNLYPLTRGLDGRVRYDDTPLREVLAALQNAKLEGLAAELQQTLTTSLSFPYIRVMHVTALVACRAARGAVDVRNLEEFVGALLDSTKSIADSNDDRSIAIAAISPIPKQQEAG